MSNRYIVRFGQMRLLGEFTTKGPQEHSRGMQLIVRSHRGTEWGDVLCEATDRTRAYLSNNDPVGRVLREATPEDERTRDDVHLREQRMFATCREVVTQKLPNMQLVDVELLFGGEKLIVYYLSEDRVDFRDLVKVLAQEFQIRVEMRQIGIRDEAKLLADYGDCGKPVCCNTHLQEMPRVSMKMAKLQKASLDPNKISGRCGRLKCCLRYEYDTYEEYQRELPKVGKMVITREGQGKVIAQEILARKLLVSMEDHRRLLIDLADIITVVGGKTPAETPAERSEENDEN